MLAHMILMSAPVPLGLFNSGFELGCYEFGLGLGVWGTKGLEPGLDNKLKTFMGKATVYWNLKLAKLENKEIFCC